jgi:glycosyltransferase involved in cell wall biosynthesis
MRIVLSNSSSRWGGVHKVTEILARGLQERGHHVAVFGYPGSMLEERMRDIAPFEPILKGMDFHPVVVARAVRALRRHRADVVLTMMRKDVTMTAPAAVALGIPVVVRHANQQPLGHNMFWRVLYGAIPDLHVTNARSTKRTLLASARWLREDRVKVIYNGIDPTPFETVEPVALGLPADALVAGYAGSFTRRKGVLELARAWSRVAEAVPQAHLALVGKGSMEAEMRSILAAAPRVHWLGYRRDIPAILRAIDVMVLPSHTEGAPNIVLEAMSAGAAIVATAVSGTPELVRAGMEARLVPARDQEALADALIEVLPDAELRQRLTAAARKRVIERFPLSRMIDSYEEMLSGVAGIPTGKRPGLQD